MEWHSGVQTAGFKWASSTNPTRLSVLDCKSSRSRGAVIQLILTCGLHVQEVEFSNRHRSSFRLDNITKQSDRKGLLSGPGRVPCALHVLRVENCFVTFNTRLNPLSQSSISPVTLCCEWGLGWSLVGVTRLTSSQSNLEWNLWIEKKDVGWEMLDSKVKTSLWKNGGPLLMLGFSSTCQFYLHWPFLSRLLRLSH